ncbi:uncharacterized protein [Ptychodera flava]|uniref:uncharacterized protein n=1 Tax=Ptychodera flava TaxID=63121 RepID=UPI00396A52DE
MVTQVVTFACVTDANPPATRYVWGNTAEDKFSHQSDNVIISSDGTEMLIRNFESQDNGVYYVTCYAENDIGRSVTAMATLNINIRSTTTVSVTEHSSTAPSTSTVSKQDGNVSSDGQHDMTSVTVASIDTSTVYDLGKISKTSQVNRVAIIGGTVGGCGFILIVFGVIFTTFCVYKSRKKSQRKESPDTHTVLNPYEDIANVNSVDFSKSSYSTVNDAYDTENNAGGTTNADSTSVEITLQARVFFKKPDRNKEDTGQSVIESDLFRVEKQGTSLSKTTTDKTNCEKTETRNDFPTNDDRKPKSQTSGHRPIILPKPKQHLQSVERSPCQTNESGYDKAVLAEATTTTWRHGQSSDDQSSQKDTDISAMYASVDLSKKGEYKHSNGEENIEICDECHEETAGQQTTCTDESAQHKNVEGLTYAELDLSSTMPRLNTKSSMETKQNDDIVYAEVRV